jgi:hypothetical protein
MTRPKTVRPRAWIYFVAATAVATALAARSPSGQPAPAPDPLASWGIPKMRARLAERLPHLVQTADAAGGQAEVGFYLTTAPRPWEALNRLSCVPERADRWRGAVHCGHYCEVLPVVEGWGEHGLVAGPFLFFGDPELLSQIQDALQD